MKKQTVFCFGFTCLIKSRKLLQVSVTFNCNFQVSMIFDCNLTIYYCNILLLCIFNFLLAEHSTQCKGCGIKNFSGLRWINFFYSKLCCVESFWPHFSLRIYNIYLQYHQQNALKSSHEYLCFFRYKCTICYNYNMCQVCVKFLFHKRSSDVENVHIFNSVYFFVHEGLLLAWTTDVITQSGSWHAWIQYMGKFVVPVIGCYSNIFLFFLFFFNLKMEKWDFKTFILFFSLFENFKFSLRIMNNWCYPYSSLKTICFLWTIRKKNYWEYTTNALTSFFISRTVKKPKYWISESNGLFDTDRFFA